ncbi:MAG: CoA transferase [Dehalococcoidia bacterium]|jgi:crotonobetainyl-CoA:carnitine CoA-transferase CaiB-like acyl-CoA transferase|nr:CoA transferase [Dehalococcoidia bacterium]
MLSPYRVLDMTSGGSCLCGRILGDLGADVIKIERPAGDPTRSIGPFVGDTPDPKKSLFWFAYNSNKRGITLDIDHPQGRDLFKRLVRSTDLLIESFPPGHMESLGLSYGVLRGLNRGLIMASITPFGQDGPYRDYAATDIVGMAMGGQMFSTGDPDRAPVRIGFPQAYLHAGAEAAAGLTLALYHRGITGEGQHVDVSMQASLALTSGSAIPTWVTLGKELPRVGNYRAGLGGGTLIRQQYPCQDGFVAFAIIGGTSGARTNRPLSEWMDREGMSDDFFRSIDWDSFHVPSTPPEVMARIEQQVRLFFMTHTKLELYQGSLERHIMLYPLATPKDILENQQLEARQFWVEMEHPELGRSITYPGPFMKASAVECTMIRRAPLIGEHNREVFEMEMGLAQEEIAALKRDGVI